jgi:hypothetical protein
MPSQLTLVCKKERDVEIISHKFVGACPWCDVVGIRSENTTVYPSLLALVPDDSPALLQWKTYPRDDVKVDTPGGAFDAHVDKLILSGITPRTTTQARASGKRAEQLLTKKAKAAEPFTKVSVYCKMFPGLIHVFVIV